MSKIDVHIKYLCLPYPSITILRKKNADCIILDCWGILNKKRLCKYGFDYLKLGSKKK